MVLLLINAYASPQTIQAITLNLFTNVRTTRRQTFSIQGDERDSGTAERLPKHLV